jgi:hypothetical protein
MPRHLVQTSMSLLKFDGYAALSLTARLAVALHCFAGYCRARAIDHPAVGAFLDHLWAFPAISGYEEFRPWEKNHPSLIHVALGDEYPRWFREFLESTGIPADEFRELIGNVVEIIFGSFYGAADNRGSLKCLRKVVSIVRKHGITAPPRKRFANSRFRDGCGWGIPLTMLERDKWRAE